VWVADRDEPMDGLWLNAWGKISHSGSGERKRVPGGCATVGRWTCWPTSRDRHVGTLPEHDAPTWTGSTRKWCAVFNCCRAFASGMVERKAGSVINMASIAGMLRFANGLLTEQPSLRSWG